MIRLTLCQLLAFNHSEFWTEIMASSGSLFRGWWKVCDACHGSRSKHSHETVSSSMKEIKLKVSGLLMSFGHVNTPVKALLCLFWTFRLICLDVLTICSSFIFRRQPLVIKLKNLSELSFYLISNPTGASSMNHSSPRKVFWALVSVPKENFGQIFLIILESVFISSIYWTICCFVG